MENKGGLEVLEILDDNTNYYSISIANSSLLLVASRANITFCKIVLEIVKVQMKQDISG